jgi:hypothetical protein
MGYRVRGTVRSKNSDKNNFLKELPGASERLELVEADLNNADSFKVFWAFVAIAGCYFDHDT